MPETASNPWKFVALGGAALLGICVVCGGIAAWLTLAGAPRPAPETQAGPWASTAQTRAIHVQFSAAEGPSLIEEGGASVQKLGLRWLGHYGEAEGEAGCKATGTCTLMEDTKLSWERREQDGKQTFVGTHKGQRAEVVATWTFEDGSPVAVLDVTAQWLVDAYPDREALILSASRPVIMLGRDLELAQVEAGNRAFADAYTPHIAQIGARSTTPVELAAWGFEGMEASATPGAAELFLELDDARNHPFRPASDCTSDKGRRTRSPRDRRLRQAGTKASWRAILRVGEGWTPTPWRNPEGRPAALAVIDAAPGTSARRLRTLLWGHSDTGDPRYGNGGFLGHRLSITKGIHTGPRGMGSSRFAETVRAAAGTGVRFANQSASAEEDEPALNEAGMDILATVEARVWVDAGNGCEDFFGNGWRKGRLAEPLADHGYTWIWSAHDAPWSAGAGLNQLRPSRRGMRAPILWKHNAARSEFGFFEAVDLAFGKRRVARALAESQLQRLIEERGVSIVRTAFDRTTVSDVLAEPGMIVREDNGHYVLDGELEKALFEMEDLSGRGLIWVTTTEEMGARYQTMAGVQMAPTPTGGVAITNTGSSRIDNWTVAVPGATANVDGNPPKGTRTHGTKTVVWFDLPPETTVLLEARDTGGELIPAASSVRWEFASPAPMTAARDTEP
jgi:hypothetical protein